MSARKPITQRGPDVIAPPPLLYAGPLLAGLAGPDATKAEGIKS